VATRAGKLVISTPNDVLFASGHTELKPAGKESLVELARVIVTVQGRQFQVAGHHRQRPDSASHYASNWELSTARALEVVKLLVSQGIASSRALGGGLRGIRSHSNQDTPDGRGKNRRIEITLQPNLDELVAAPVLSVRVGPKIPF